jgi:hypothetical protein
MQRILILGVALAAALSAANAPAAEAQSRRYSMADLRSLARSESWSELVQHIEDVRPSARNATWKRLLKKGATEYLRSLGEQEQVVGLFLAERLRTRYPALRRHRPFMEARADVGIEAFPLCYRLRGYNCTEELEKFMNGDPDNHELTFRAAKVLESHTTLSKSVTFFLRAVEGSNKRAWCEDEHLGDAVVQGLSRPEEAIATAAKKLAFDLCWEHGARKPVIKYFSAHPDSRLAQRMCEALAHRDGALSSFQASFCREKLKED